MLCLTVGVLERFFCSADLPYPPIDMFPPVCRVCLLVAAELALLGWRVGVWLSGSLRGI